VLRDRAEAVARVGERDAIAYLPRTILVRERTDTRADLVLLWPVGLTIPLSEEVNA